LRPDDSEITVTVPTIVSTGGDWPARRTPPAVNSKTPAIRPVADLDVTVVGTAVAAGTPVVESG
jgi:hypothetical protein